MKFLVPRAQMARHKTRAFTLLELLVVCLIIGILAGLLVPALARGKTAAISARCRSNLHQLGLGLAIYVDDYSLYPSPDPDWWVVMSHLVDLPARDRGVLRCPSTAGSATTAPDGTRFLPQQRAYGYNLSGYRNATDFTAHENFGLGATPAINGASAHLTRESDVLVPSQMLAIGDAFGLVPKSTGVVTADTVMVVGDFMLRNERLSLSAGFPLTQGVAEASARHRERANVVFCDGHTETVAFKKLFLDKSDDSLARWNKDHEPHRSN